MILATMPFIRLYNLDRYNHRNSESFKTFWQGTFNKLDVDRCEQKSILAHQRNRRIRNFHLALVSDSYRSRSPQSIADNRSFVDHVHSSYLDAY